MKRNPKWNKEELILALNLYFNKNPANMSPKSPEVIELSKVLNQLKKTNETLGEGYRNPNSVYMKLCNFLRFDEEYRGLGLSNGSKMDEVVWNEFSHDKNSLKSIANSIVTSLEDNIEDIFNEEELFPEGKTLFKSHLHRERNRKAVNIIKNRALKNNNLKCQVCGFDFFEVYGDIGRGYIKCHHIVPVSEYDKLEKDKTSVSDMVLVCANCHRMLHRKRPWLSVRELKEILKKES